MNSQSPSLEGPAWSGFCWPLWPQLAMHAFLLSLCSRLTGCLQLPFRVNAPPGKPFPLSLDRAPPRSLLPKSLLLLSFPISVVTSSDKASHTWQGALSLSSFLGAPCLTTFRGLALGFASFLPWSEASCGQRPGFYFIYFSTTQEGPRKS